MSTDPVERLERELRRAVRTQAAPAPRWRERVWSRLRLPIALSAAAVALGGGAALAASQLVPEGPPLEELTPPPRPDEGAGVVEGPSPLPALRMRDPHGGLPWGLRVFSSSRGGSCVQVGRVQGGRLGRVVAEAAGGDRFRPLRAIPGVNSLCGGVQRRGFPVLRGLRRVEVRGGSSDRRRCAGGPCPIDQVSVLRYGLLGPAAREARFVDGDRRVTTTQLLDPAQGGAYLFVERVDPRPFQVADAAQQETGRRFAEELRRLEANGVPAPERLRRAGRIGRSAARPTGAPGQAELLRGDDTVTATFRGGQILQVAGRGRSTAALPGVQRRQGATPDVRTRLEVASRGTGAERRFTIAFRAPVAISRADRGYTLTATGPDGRRCSRAIPRGGQSTSVDIARGERVVFEDIGARRNTGAGRRTWCPGTFTLRVGYRTGDSGFRGRTVGTHQFTISP